MKFWQAALFQFVNIKAVMMAMSSAIVFTIPGEDYALSAIIVGVAFSLVNLPCISVWTFFGVGLKQLLSNERSLKVFNWSLASLTAASVVLF